MQQCFSSHVLHIRATLIPFILNIYTYATITIDVENEFKRIPTDIIKQVRWTILFRRSERMFARVETRVVTTWLRLYRAASPTARRIISLNEPAPRPLLTH